MNRALLIGDVHCVPEEIEDCQRLIDYVRKVAEQEKIKTVIFLGDQYNSHSVMRVEVMAFWRSAFEALSYDDLDVYALTGNHDYAGAKLPIHALMAHKEQITVVDRPMLLGYSGILMMPYYDDAEEFVSASKVDVNIDGEQIEVKTLICHQTFEGSKYDNGMYAPGGVDPELLPQKTVISGHIHKPQEFGKVTYIGAPRWRTLSDANVDRAIWIYDFDAEGNVVGKKSFDTSICCRKICALEDTPSNPIDPATLNSTVDWRIDVKGPADWIERRKKELAGPGVRLRTFNTTKATPKIRESEGIDMAFNGFLKKYTPKYGTDREVLAAMAQERLR